MPAAVTGRSEPLSGRDTPPPPAPQADADAPDAGGERQVRLTAQTILADHLRDRRTSQQRQKGKATDPLFWEGMRLDLTGAVLIAPDFSHCHPATAVFTGVTFAGDAWFVAASFPGGARFDGVSFAGVAGFTAAFFAGDAELIGASFEGASFAGAAGFGGVSFEGASFAGGARFDEAVVAVPRATLVWPEGWRVAVQPDGRGRLEREAGVGGGDPVPPAADPADSAGSGGPSNLDEDGENVG